MAGPGAGLGGCIALTALLTGHTSLWQPLVAGTVAIAAAAYGSRRTMSLGPVCLLLLMALLYGIVYTGVSRVIVTVPDLRRVQAVHRIAAALENGQPVVCDQTVAYRDCFVISRHLERALHRHPPLHGAYLLVTALREGTQPEGELLAQAAPLTLWRIAGE